MQDQPNIVFILTDQQNSLMMSCAGNRHVHTPAMDSLAAEGVRFDRAYCTNPVCVPSRFSLMTGRMPSAIGMLSNRTAHIDAIPEPLKKGGLGYLMRKAGYDAAYAGKVHLPKMSATDVGFDYICPDEREDLAIACSEFISKKRRRPFFLVASFINPHDICYMALRDFSQTESEQSLVGRGSVACETLDASLARPDGVDDASFFTEHCPPLPPNFEPHDDEPEIIRLMLEQRPFRKKCRDAWSEKRWREHRWAYARLTEMVDRQISRVLDALADSVHAHRTVVVFTSDHGDMDAAHRMEHKSTLYDEACRIPLIIRPPGGLAHGRVDRTHLVSNGLDLVPTFCDWAGMAPPSELTGMSLRQLVEDDSHVSWRQSVPVESAIGRAIVTKRFKYSLYDYGASREQLIDLDSDPYEQRNALNDAEHRQQVERLRNLFQATFGSEQRHPADVLKAAADA